MLLNLLQSFTYCVDHEDLCYVAINVVHLTLGLYMLVYEFVMLYFGINPEII